MSFLAYELACNPDIQQTLYEEILQTVNEAGDDQKISYEQLQSMKYLDQVLSESLRKWPAALIADRQCTQDYELKYDNKVTKFEKNVNTFMIPIWMFHRFVNFIRLIRNRKLLMTFNSQKSKIFPKSREVRS